MKKLCAAVAFLACSGALLIANTKIPAVRSFEATYVGTIAALPASAKKAEVWVPLPSDGPYQSVADLKVEAPAPFTLETDSAGNRLAHFVLDKPGQLGKDLEVKASYRVTRREAVAPAPGSVKAVAPPGASELLRPNRLVPLTSSVFPPSSSCASSCACACAISGSGS